jgi:adenylate/nucleoside-diphosphate kinase
MFFIGLIHFRAPWKYTNQVLPKKLPPCSNPITVQGLPIIGYLEQSVATSLVDALSSLGHVKPKYPFKSLKGSAIEYLALYLKCIFLY